MKLPANIERSGFRRGEYVGYTSKGAQRIRRGGAGWQTYAPGSASGEFVSASAATLQELGAKLEAADKAN